MGNETEVTATMTDGEIRGYVTYVTPIDGGVLRVDIKHPFAYEPWLVAYNAVGALAACIEKGQEYQIIFSNKPDKAMPLITEMLENLRKDGFKLNL